MGLEDTKYRLSTEACMVELYIVQNCYVFTLTAGRTETLNFNQADMCTEI